MEFSFPYPKVGNTICHSRSRSFPGITTSHSRSQNSGMEFPFPFPFPKIGNEIFIPVPVPKSWECNLSFPFPFPKFGNGLSHSRSRSQMSKSHSRSPLVLAGHLHGGLYFILYTYQRLLYRKILCEETDLVLSKTWPKIKNARLPILFEIKSYKEIDVTRFNFQ